MSQTFSMPRSSELTPSEGGIVDDDDPMKAAGREIAAAARAVATGVAVAARARAERQAERRFEEARRLDARGRAAGAWGNVAESRTGGAEAVR
jgi:hypothetical protein